MISIIIGSAAIILGLIAVLAMITHLVTDLEE